ncbi:MAG: hypothetical protein M0P09_02320 [Acholeplasmataceae bacterium]|nr:hypothetical protein [Acholeplasmataceae bacterium]
MKMSIKISLIAVLLFVMMPVAAQNLYFDPITTLALKGYSDNLKNKQNETIEQQTKLQQAQAFVASQMAWANDLQNKIYKGLREVSGTVQNGVQLVRIYENVNKCISYTGDIADVVADNPEFAVFGAKSTGLAWQTITEISVEITDILQEGATNLAYSGDRYKFLYEIDQKLTRLRIILLQIKIDIERAVNLGFWRAINPFQGYINTDKDIVENIMYQYKHMF